MCWWPCCCIILIFYGIKFLLHILSFLGLYSGVHFRAERIFYESDSYQRIFHTVQRRRGKSSGIRGSGHHPVYWVCHVKSETALLHLITDQNRGKFRKTICRQLETFGCTKSVICWYGQVKILRCQIQIPASMNCPRYLMPEGKCCMLGEGDEGMTMWEVKRSLLTIWREVLWALTVVCQWTVT